MFGTKRDAVSDGIVKKLSPRNDVTRIDQACLLVVHDVQACNGAAITVELRDLALEGRSAKYLILLKLLFFLLAALSSQIDFRWIVCDAGIRFARCGPVNVQERSVERFSLPKSKRSAARYPIHPPVKNILAQFRIGIEGNKRAEALDGIGARKSVLETGKRIQFPQT